MVKAVLSNITDWSKVERVLGKLDDLFKGFDLQYYSNLNESQIDEEFIPWFLERSAGGLTMRRDLKNLIGTSRKLLEHSHRSGSLDKYFTSLVRFNGNDPIELARILGSNKSPHKLAGLGIPIASEMLKNIGYDVSKPDRHINRAMGSFGLVNFSNWKDKSDQKPPIASENEVIKVMRIMESFAKKVSEKVCYLDNAIWLLCCKSGLHFTNDQLSALSGWKLK
jgi:hypothetical protein